jgi:DNA-binding transcriptional ArsR family regulator
MLNTARSSEQVEPLFAEADVTPVASLLADSARSAMLWALSNGRALPAGELARIGAVSPSVASAHLSKLTTGGLVTSERHGRHRYYRLADNGIVAALEALAAIAPPRRASSNKEAHAARAIRHARTCYDHLAGTLGVSVADALVSDGSLKLDNREYHVSAAGVIRLAKIGVDVPGIIEVTRHTRRPFARACLDWSERRYHLAGALGAALVERFLNAEWVERMPSTRALKVTSAGRRALRRHLDIKVA